jgi:hypothetical protein
MSDNTHYIVNTLQASMLSEIAARDGHATFDNLQYVLGISRSLAQRQMRELRERQFVSTVRSGCDHKMLHRLTDDGWHALGAHQRRMGREHGGQASAGGTVAVASRRSLFDLPDYQPAAGRAYYRNDGLAHIASRGLAC